MNRAIAIPAGLCLVAIAALLATIRGESRRSTAFSASLPSTVQRSDLEVSSSPPTISTAEVVIPHETPLLSEEEARGRLTALVDEYQRPWQEWQNSPHSLYSRAGPRQIPPISAEIAIVPMTEVLSENLMLGTITVKIGTRSEHIPCVVDRMSKVVWLSTSGQWLTEEQWVKKAPVP